jgi:hypothetical protein
MIKDMYPTSVIDKLLDEFYRAIFFFFSKLVLRFGYQQIWVWPKDVPKIAFRTHGGHYEFLVMPSGCCANLFNLQVHELFIV